MPHRDSDGPSGVGDAGSPQAGIPQVDNAGAVRGAARSEIAGSEIAEDRRKWNARYQAAGPADAPPAPHAMALRWRGRFCGGAMLDAACGLGKGVAGALGAFAPIYAVDVSDVAVFRARRLFASQPEARANVRWIAGDVTALRWPENYFGLVCSFGFTDLPFLRRMRTAIRPGGMLLYEGFSRRQLEVRPEMDPAWTLTVPELSELLSGWELLETGESDALHRLVRCAAIRPGRS
jgi:SAM-dependent methyltransferase